ncbi:MAG TPA: RagB/SusD family nutrient uptake outer membrane protein [Chitinophaga sp.]|nr:RagB/SusD family nutrient uptake outer membrane protein [Chitinophaga sp.]
MKHFKIIIIFLCLFWYGCSSQLDVTPKDAIPQNSLSTSDIAQLRTGVYSTMEDLLFSFYFDFDIRAENLKGGPGFYLVDPVSMTASNATITSLWQTAYKGLSKVNFLIPQVDTLGAGATAALLSYKGEALYFRALIYYNLVTRWGGVPIVLRNTSEPIQRSAEADVWTQIKSDLAASRKLIGSPAGYFYVSDMAVKALMARVCLATGDNANAILYADSLITSGKYTLAADSAAYSSMFVSASTSKEIIFGLANNSTSNPHVFYSQVNDTKATWPYSPSDSAFKSLYSDAVSPVSKSGDKRKPAVFGSDPTRVIKYPNGKTNQQLVASNTPNQTPIIVSRIAEMYLIKAEAQGAAAGAATLAPYFTARYKTAPATATVAGLSELQYQDLILNERFREFYCEGYKWYDIKRTKRTDLLTSWGGRDYLLYYPIPQTERDLAGYTQNDGY